MFCGLPAPTASQGEARRWGSRVAAGSVIGIGGLEAHPTIYNLQSYRFVKEKGGHCPAYIWEIGGKDLYVLLDGGRGEVIIGAVIEMD